MLLSPFFRVQNEYAHLFKEKFYQKCENFVTTEASSHICAFEQIAYSEQKRFYSKNWTKNLQQRQSCESDRVFGSGSGSGLNLTKISGSIRA